MTEHKASVFLYDLVEYWSKSLNKSIKVRYYQHSDHHASGTFRMGVFTLGTISIRQSLLVLTSSDDFSVQIQLSDPKAKVGKNMHKLIQRLNDKARSIVDHRKLRISDIV